MTLNDAIFYFIREVKHLLDGEWLFFQADTLVIFQTILSHPDFRKNAANKDHITLIASICRGFVKLLKRNRLALV